MKQTAQSALAAAILGLIASAGYSQTASGTAGSTPNPYAGTYRDTTLSQPQRIQAADGVVASGTNGPDAALAATFMLNLRPVIHLLHAKPNFADSVLTDPTLGGKITDPNSRSSVYAAAIYWKATATGTPEAGLAYIAQHLSDANLSATGKASLKNQQAGLASTIAQKAFTEGDCAGVIATLTPHLGYGTPYTHISLIARAKIRLKSDDMLAWAKLAYISVPFGSTQAGIDIVSSALRAADTGLGRANAFIEFQKTGTGTNPLAKVSLPEIAWPADATSVESKLLGTALADGNLAALKLAARSFAEAPSGSSLNTATGLVAQWLRNIDMNIARANAFVESQTKGESYPITELQ